MTPFGRFRKQGIVLGPRPETRFHCPVRGEAVDWEAKDVFNPAATVFEGRVHLLYRAEDTVGRYLGTSRLGLAVSDDGLTFSREDQPVFYPDHDAMLADEWEGGCEDPRLVRREDGLFVMTYTAYDGVWARLCVASSPDLRTWTKHGRAFRGSRYADRWSKSGSVVGRATADGIVAERIGGRYWMYWGESDVYAATSDDLLTWRVVETGDRSLRQKHDLGENEGFPRVVFGVRSGRFDSALVEPGPPAVITDAGIVFLYNAANRVDLGDATMPEHSYSAGWVITDPRDPSVVISRGLEPFLFAEEPYEMVGQLPSVTFIEGIVSFQGRWRLYYGTADSKIAVAVSDGA